MCDKWLKLYTRKYEYRIGSIFAFRHLRFTILDISLKCNCALTFAWTILERFSSLLFFFFFQSLETHFCRLYEKSQMDFDSRAITGPIARDFGRNDYLQQKYSLNKVNYKYQRTALIKPTFNSLSSICSIKVRNDWTDDYITMDNI